MGAITDKTKCIGCGRCMDVCPGNLIRKNTEGKAYLKNEEDCWSCASCIKECPVGAIFLRLPAEFGGVRADMHAKTDNNITEWEIDRADGKKIVFITDTKEANKY